MEPDEVVTPQETFTPPTGSPQLVPQVIRFPPVSWSQDQFDAAVAAVAALRSDGGTLRPLSEFYDELLGIPHVPQPVSAPQGKPIRRMIVLLDLMAAAESPEVQQTEVIEAVLALVTHPGLPSVVYFPYADWLYNLLHNVDIAVRNAPEQPRLNRRILLTSTPTYVTEPGSHYGFSLEITRNPLRVVLDDTDIAQSMIVLLGGGKACQDIHQTLVARGKYQPVPTVTVVFPNTGGAAAQSTGVAADLVWPLLDPETPDWQSRWEKLCSMFSATTPQAPPVPELRRINGIYPDAAGHVVTSREESASERDL